jgi:hypothetical protein
MSDLALRDLSHAECLALLRTANLGHLGLTRRALPAVVPAHYLLTQDRVLIHVSTGIDPVPWVDGEIVTLHVSAFNDDQRDGWSVSVTGAGHGTPDLADVDDIPRAPWITRGGGDVIAIPTDLVSGERLGAEPEAIAGDHPSPRTENTHNSADL